MIPKYRIIPTKTGHGLIVQIKKNWWGWKNVLDSTYDNPTFLSVKEAEYFIEYEIKWIKINMVVASKKNKYPSRIPDGPFKNMKPVYYEQKKEG